MAQEKVFIPIHTTKLRGHHPNDLIIIYSKYQDLETKELNPEFMGKYVAQWFATDYVNDKRGISMPVSTPLLFTYEQMANVG